MVCLWYLVYVTLPSSSMHDPVFGSIHLSFSLFLLLALYIISLNSLCVYFCPILAYFSSQLLSTKSITSYVPYYLEYVC